MPELPEVETIRRDLEPLVTGRRIEGVDVDQATLPLLAGPTVDIDALRTSLVGRVITRLGRRGKYLLFGLNDGRTLVAHLRMTGRMVWRDAGAPPEQYERARIELDRGHHVRWADLRKFGTWRVVDDLDQYLTKLGPEPIDESFDFAAFRRAVAKRRVAIKTVLLDQRRMAGLGNIYVDEALFEAGIRPDVPAADVPPAALRRLHAATRAVLERGIANRGASFKDYVDGMGAAGTQHMHVQVFRRTGKPCYRCGTAIERIILGGRSTHFCPACQKRPRRQPRADRA